MEMRYGKWPTLYYTGNRKKLARKYTSTYEKFSSYFSEDSTIIQFSIIFFEVEKAMEDLMGNGENYP